MVIPCTAELRLNVATLYASGIELVDGVCHSLPYECDACMQLRKSEAQNKNLLGLLRGIRDELAERDEADASHGERSHDGVSNADYRRLRHKYGRAKAQARREYLVGWKGRYRRWAEGW